MSRELTAEQLAQLRGQSVEGSFYLAECCNCGEMYPSNKLDGGEPLFSGDYGECFCHLCGADDTDIADNGAWGSEAVTAWNYQQKRVEALLDELERKETEIIRLSQKSENDPRIHEIVDLKERIAELEARHTKLRDRMAAIHNTIRLDGVGTSLSGLLSASKRAWEESAPDAGINLTVEG